MILDGNFERGNMILKTWHMVLNNDDPWKKVNKFPVWWNGTCWWSLLNRELLGGIAQVWDKTLASIYLYILIVETKLGFLPTDFWVQPLLGDGFITPTGFTATSSNLGWGQTHGGLHVDLEDPGSRRMGDEKRRCSMLPKLLTVMPAKILFWAHPHVQIKATRIMMYQYDNM